MWVMHGEYGSGDGVTSVVRIFVVLFKLLGFIRFTCAVEDGMISSVLPLSSLLFHTTFVQTRWLQNCVISRRFRRLNVD